MATGTEEDAVQPKTAPAKKVSKDKTPDFISVESFIVSASPVYNLSKIQEYAFKNMMRSKGMGVVSGMDTYVPYLEKYLMKGRA